MDGKVTKLVQQLNVPPPLGLPVGGVVHKIAPFWASRAHTWLLGFEYESDPLRLNDRTGGQSKLGIWIVFANPSVKRTMTFTRSSPGPAVTAAFCRPANVNPPSMNVKPP